MNVPSWLGYCEAGAEAIMTWIKVWWCGGVLVVRRRFGGGADGDCG